MKNKLWIFLLVPIVAVAILLYFVKISNKGKVTIGDVSIEAKVYFNKDYKSPGCNVILISIDTLRADHLGCYDYPRNTTPNIDKFSTDSVIFKEHIAQASNTENSHASIFTSLIPAHHGAFFGIKQPLREEIVTMAEIFKDNNYKTVSYNGGGQISEKFGFAQGFDLYESFRPETFIKKVESAIDWLKSNPNEKFFLFLHTYEVHHPYTPKKDYLDLFVRKIIEYVRHIRY